MSQITRRITTALIAAALIVPISVSTAPAQSSFGSSDFLTSSTADPKASELEEAYRRYADHLGYPRDSILERAAASVTQRAIDGEFPFSSGQFEFTESGIEYTLFRAPISEADGTITTLNTVVTTTPRISPARGVFCQLFIGQKSTEKPTTSAVIPAKRARRVNYP